MLFYFFPLFLSVFASSTSIGSAIDEFILSILETNCYPINPSNIPLLGFDSSNTDQRVFNAMNIFDDTHLSLLEEALNDGVDFNVPYLPNQFPIHFAIDFERYEIFDLLVKKVNLNQRCALGLTSLHHALLAGNFYFIRELISNGANPHEMALLEWEEEQEERSLIGRTFVEQSFYKTSMTGEFITFMMERSLFPIDRESAMKAMEIGNEPLLLELVKRLSPISDDRSLIEFYCDTLEFPSVREYLLSQFDIEQKAKNYVSGLTIYQACEDNNLPAVLVFVSILKVDINAKNREGKTALHVASERGHKEIVELLINNDLCDVTVKDIYGKSAFHQASENGHIKIVELLISVGYDHNAKDNFDQTALHWASEKGHKEVVELIFSKGCDLNQIDMFGKTALHWASEKGHTEIVKFLLNNGSDIEAIDIDGKTAFLWASYNGHTIVVELLVSMKCDIEAIDVLGLTALHHSTMNNHFEVIKFLVNHGFKINTKDMFGHTALHWSCELGNFEIVEFLVCNGSDIEAKNIDGKTALFGASEKGFGRIVNFLKTYAEQLK